jgi:N-methylhydantoinase A
VTARGPIIPFNRAMTLPAMPGQPKSTREVHAWSDGLRVPVYDRSTLAADQSVKGPAIIEERETTTVIPPDWTATVDAIGCIFARKA